MSGASTEFRGGQPGGVPLGMGDYTRPVLSIAVSAISIARSSPSSCSFSTPCSPTTGAAMRTPDGSGVNAAPGLVVSRKPPHRPRRITVCLPPRPRLGNVSIFGAMLGSTVVVRSCFTLRRPLDDFRFLSYVKVDSNPATPRQPRKSTRLLPPLHDERVNTVREEPNFQLVFYMRDVTDGMHSP